MHATDALDRLRSSSDSTFAGTIVLPSDDAYDAARTPWNLSIDQRPAAVATPADVDDLRLLLAAAAESGLTLAVQPSGHGAFSSLESSIVVRMSAFDELEIDAAAGTARIGAGVRWGAVIDALESSGFAAPAGTSAVVTATGYTLGGGHSWFSRTSGLGAASLVAATLLRPDGTHERIDDDSDADAMWALRGAGGSVGVVTSIEIELVPTPHLSGGSLTFDVADGPVVLRAARDLAATAPESLNLFVSSMRMPDAPMLPEAIRGKSYVTVEALVTDEAGAGLLDPIRAVAPVVREQFGPTSPAAMAAASVEPTEPSPSRGSSTALRALDDDLIDALFAFHAHPEQQPLVGINLRMLGGALDAPGREGFASLAGASWLVMGLAPLFPGAPAEPGAASLAALQELLAPLASERMVPTFLAPDETLERCASDADVDRLRSIRDRLDPDALLHEGRLPR